MRKLPPHLENPIDNFDEIMERLDKLHKNLGNEQGK